MENSNNPQATEKPGLFFVKEICAPDSPRAKKVLVYRYVVMAKNEAEAIRLAVESVSADDEGCVDEEEIADRLKDGTWTATPIEGPVCSISFVLQDRPRPSKK